jgi:hypothetical protein
LAAVVAAALAPAGRRRRAGRGRASRRDDEEEGTGGQRDIEVEGPGGRCGAEAREPALPMLPPAEAGAEGAACHLGGGAGGDWGWDGWEEEFRV